MFWEKNYGLIDDENNASPPIFPFSVLPHGLSLMDPTISPFSLYGLESWSLSHAPMAEQKSLEEKASSPPPSSPYPSWGFLLLVWVKKGLVKSRPHKVYAATWLDLCHTKV